MELRELMALLTPEEERSSLEELIGDFEEEEPESFFDRYPELVNGYDSAQTFAEEIRDRVVTLGTVLIWYLAERGLLQNENATVTALVNRQQVRQYESQAVVARSFEGSLPVFLTAFLGRHKLTQAEAEELRQIIEEATE